LDGADHVGRTLPAFKQKPSPPMDRGYIPPEANEIITKAMAKAQEADAAGDKAACEQALEEVERTIRH
jgi:hypothetical protein